MNAATNSPRAAAARCSSSQAEMPASGGAAAVSVSPTIRRHTGSSTANENGLATTSRRPCSASRPGIRRPASGCGSEPRSASVARGDGAGGAARGEDRCPVVELEQRHPAAGPQQPDEVAEGALEGPVGQVHEHALAPDRVERGGGQRQLREVALEPAQVRRRRIGAPLGDPQQLAIAVQPGDERLGVLGRQPRRLQADAAPGVEHPHAGAQRERAPQRDADGAHAFEPVGLLEEAHQVVRRDAAGVAEAFVQVTRHAAEA